jgi:hypothetical protein
MIVSIVLGIWLAFSVFLWPHGDAQFVNAWISAGVLLSLAVATVRFPWLHAASTPVGMWLIASSLFLEASRVTLWNHLIIGLMVVVVGLLGGSSVPRPRRSWGDNRIDPFPSGRHRR